MKSFDFAGEHITKLFLDKLIQSAGEIVPHQNLKLNPLYVYDEKSKIKRLVSEKKKFSPEVLLLFQQRIARDIKECLLSSKKLSTDFKVPKQETEAIEVKNVNVRLPDDT